MNQERSSFLAADILTWIISVGLGLLIGVGVYTFIFAKGHSYLADDPTACANCHIMRGHVDGWVKSTHHAVATCNDCHVPRGFIGKYKTKATNGFWDSFYFTTGKFHEPIQISEHNREIVEDNCRRCHQDMVMAMDSAHQREDKLSCVGCHGSVGHPQEDT